MEGHLRKRSPGTWTLVYELVHDPATGKRRRKWETVRGTKKEAERLLRQRLGEIETGGYIEASKLTVGQFLDRWLTDYAAQRLRPASFRDYESAMRIHVCPILGSLLLSKLTPLHVQSLYSHLLERGVSAHRCLRIHRVIRHALSHGVRWQLVSRNVADSVVPPRPAVREMATLDADQSCCLLAAIQNTTLEAPVAVALYTGLRRSELLALRWKDVDFSAGSLAVVQTLQRVTGEGLVTLPPKTARSRRKVALSPQTVAILRRHHARQAEQRLALGPAWQDGDWVFTGPDGSPMSPDAVSHGFAKVARALGLPGTGLHMLRHSHASLLLRENIHVKVVSERLGHSTVSITLDQYSHVLPGLQDAAALAFDHALAAQG